ncbi:hypothetical protein AXG93_3846s1020 [Marchantia polymorpha subsp. ruderalis]|uniref:Uncharacterized protein n=1 Tax=Marchantia polymorpha subsp. ruderalis TaxID=1480154 RepID=A0A176VJ55_MARPO|nr:hypothetical protein AXG93_3846s1020 [Marchantia polymorpha subsp. ruderalis]
MKAASGGCVSRDSGQALSLKSSDNVGHAALSVPKGLALWGCKSMGRSDTDRRLGLDRREIFTFVERCLLEGTHLIDYRIENMRSDYFYPVLIALFPKFMTTGTPDDPDTYQESANYVGRGHNPVQSAQTSSWGFQGFQLSLLGQIGACQSLPQLMGSEIRSDGTRDFRLEEVPRMPELQAFSRALDGMSCKKRWERRRRKTTEFIKEDGFFCAVTMLQKKNVNFPLLDSGQETRSGAPMRKLRN